MWLLLNACDVDLSVQAIFLQNPNELAESTTKKMQQLELYEIPSFICIGSEQGQVCNLEPESQDTKYSASFNSANVPSATYSSTWSWLQVCSPQQVAQLLADSRYIISV